MKLITSISLVFILSILKTFPNGGPIDGSAVYQTGDVILMNQPNIKLVKEDLNIKIEGDYSLMHVTYFLSNTGTAKEDISYGFPVDFMETDLHYELVWNEEFLPLFSYSLNGNPLKVEKKTAEEAATVKLLDFQGEPYDVKTKRQWHMTSFSIDLNEIVKLEVKYKIKNGFTDWGTSKDFFPGFDKRSLVYDLSPAGSWGDGQVNSFSASVDFSNISKYGDNLDVKGLDMTKDNGIYLFNASNFDLKNCGNINIEYSLENQGMSNYSWKHRLDKSKIKNYTVSSQLEGNYKKDYLFDGNFNTAWVEGKADNGVNEKITIELDDYKLAAIGIVAGYTNKPKTYLANNRIKKVLVERELVDHNDPTKTRIESKEVSLEDPKWAGPLNQNNFFGMLNIVGDYGEGYQKVRKVTITILETYPGAKYDDTCISEIFLMGYTW